MFIRLGTEVVRFDEIQSFDLNCLEELRVVAHLRDRLILLNGMDAVDAVMRVCPEAFEGKRLRFVRHAWALHNLVGHPVLQVLAWLGLTRLGLRIHDALVPLPKGRYRESNQATPSKKTSS